MSSKTDQPDANGARVSRASRASRVSKESDAGSNSTVKGKRFVLAWVLGAIGLYHSMVGPHAARARRAAFAPDGKPRAFDAYGLFTIPEYGEGVDNLLFAWMCMLFIGLFDVAVARLFGAGRYFALHTFVNVLTTWYSVADFMTVMRSANPYETNTCVAAGSPCANKVALDVTIGIHLWHTLAYSLKPIDLVHHIPAHIVCGIGASNT